MSKANVQYQLTVNTKKLKKQLRSVGGLRAHLAKTLFELGAKALNKKITVEYDIKEFK